jgi:hypothetical protein
MQFAISSAVIDLCAANSDSRIAGPVKTGPASRLKRRSGIDNRDATKSALTLLLRPTGTNIILF